MMNSFEQLILANEWVEAAWGMASEAQHATGHCWPYVPEMALRRRAQEVAEEAEAVVVKELGFQFSDHGFSDSTLGLGLTRDRMAEIVKRDGVVGYVGYGYTTVPNVVFPVAFGYQLTWTDTRGMGNFGTLVIERV